MPYSRASSSKEWTNRNTESGYTTAGETIVTNEKDRNTAQRIMNSANIPMSAMSAQEFADLCRVVEAALTTARKEEREAAFGEAERIASDFRRLDQDTLWSIYKTLSVETALVEAAATKGGNDG